MTGSRQSGFSLIELTIVMTVLALASVPVLGQFTQVAISASINEEIQTASQLAQERAEQVLALRRERGYEAVAPGTVSDVLTGPYAEYSRRVTVTEPSALGGCATGATCKSVVVVVQRGSSRRAEIVHVLSDYRTDIR